jgi:hypothetical protein
MSFRIVQAGNALPTSYPVDPNAEFQPGMVAQLGVMGNNIVVGVSDGTAPLGIIDDIKTRAFTAPSVDEVVIVNVPESSRMQEGGHIITTVDQRMELENPNIIPSSFITSPVDVQLIPRNGVVVFPAHTILNFDADGDGMPDSIRTVVNYTYQIPNIPGDDTTAASSKVTVWFQRMIFQTDQYETNRRYPINANLFVSERGLLTTQQPSPDHPGIAIVTGAPSAIHGTLEALLL